MMLQRRHASLFQLVGRVRRCQSIAATAQTRIAIVGSGPAGFYTAKYLLEKNPAVHVDLIEKLPVPYGLVRYGVAPDHPEVKSVQETFAKVAANERFRFFGNVELEEAAVAAGYDGAAATWSSGGSDNEDTTTTATRANNKNSNSSSNNNNKSLVNKVTLRELSKYYQGGVVLACGAENDRRLGLEHEEDCRGVHSARSFVNWYNGHPDYVHVGDTIDLSNVEDVVIVGQGNVAVDCARILTKSPDELAESDICDHALAKLRNSAVKRVHVVGRRGAAQAAFTIKELRELTRLSGVTVEISEDDLNASMTEASANEVASSRPKSRIMDLMKETSAAAAGGHADKHIHLRFLLQPLALETRQDQQEGGNVLPFPLDVSRRVQLDVTTLDSTSVGAKVFEPKKARSLTGVKFGATALTGPAGSQQATLLNTTTTIPAQMLLKSVGYKSVRLRGVPFDSMRHVVPHVQGRVLMDYDEAATTTTTTTSSGSDSEQELLAKDGGMRQLSQTLRGILEIPDAADPAVAVDSGEEEAGVGAVASAAAAPAPSSSSSGASLYVVGWLKRGPSGTIASSVTDAKETAASILEDLAAAAPPPAAAAAPVESGSESVIVSSSGGGGGGGGLDPAMRIAALRSPSAIGWQRYRQIDQWEVGAGGRAQPPRPRTKLVERAEMIDLKASLRKKAQERERAKRVKQNKQ